MRLWLSVFVLCLSLAALAQENVILVTIDGVRWQEVFYGTDSELYQGPRERVIFRNLYGETKQKGFFLGDVKEGRRLVFVANPVRKSLPAYQSIMAGFEQPCLTNDCGPIRVETVAERAQRELNLGKHLVATLASWSRLEWAAQRTQGYTFVNAGMANLVDHLEDDESKAINEAQWEGRDPSTISGEHNRFDKYTIQHAFRYLRKHHPRFFYVSLNDSDDAAHDGNYPKYLASLHQADEFLGELFKRLNEMGDYGKNTTVIVTTDHGRGTGHRWKHHGIEFPESRYIWLFATGPHTKKPEVETDCAYSHNNLRPTIEALLGLSPIVRGGACTGPIAEITGVLEKGWVSKIGLNF